MIEIRPHSGPQETFLASPADIAIYGGAAGGGKTWALILEPCRHLANGNFGATIFRRTSPQITNQGGLWDESMRLFPFLGGKPLSYKMEWTFPTGARIKFSHLEHATNVLDYQGSQLPFIGFDELPHFDESQFWYMLSRNRSTCGVRPYVRATCNPDADSWVAALIAWWIDQDTGYAIPERSGVLRWFYRVHDRLEWYDSEQEARDAHPDLSAITAPKSLTFIAARLQDNPTLMKADPGYLANLMGMPLVDRERLLGGNWKIRPTAGNFFKLEWLSKFVDAAPRVGKRVRYWDKAGGESLKSDRSAGVLMCESDGLFYIEDVVYGRWTPMARNQVIMATAEKDHAKHGPSVELWIEREPGHNSKEVMAIHAREFARFAPRFDAVNTAKEVRARPLSAQCEAGNIRLCRGPWVKDLLDELTNFPPPKDSQGHDDLVDACSGAFNKLTLAPTQGVALPRGFKSVAR